MDDIRLSKKEVAKLYQFHSVRKKLPNLDCTSSNCAWKSKDFMHVIAKYTFISAPCQLLSKVVDVVFFILIWAVSVHSADCITYLYPSSNLDLIVQNILIFDCFTFCRIPS